MGGSSAEPGGIKDPARMWISGGGKSGGGGLDGTMGGWAVDTGVCGVGRVSVERDGLYRLVAESDWIPRLETR